MEKTKQQVINLASKLPPADVRDVDGAGYPRSSSPAHHTLTKASRAS